MKRRLFVGLAILLTVAAVGLGAADYTITPWPYGAILWVGTPPNDAQATVEFATKAVQDVFEFWAIRPPTPALNWAHPVQTSSQAWYEEELKQIQSPSVPITDLISRDRSLIRGTPLPEPGSDELLVLPAPSWKGEKIPPLIIGIYPDRESMNATCADYSSSGLYGTPSLSIRELMLQEELPGSLRAILASHYDIIIHRNGDWTYLLYHELAHWLTDLVCLKQGADMSAFPPTIREGMADYTAHSLTGEDFHWQAVAAAWAQSGGRLDNVPPPLWYDVGTSVVAYLVENEGIYRFWDRLPAFTAHWARQAAVIAPGWREWLAAATLMDRDRALYEAKLERLSLCAWMLAPVIPSEAKRLVDELYSGKGRISDIDSFWEVVSAVPPLPSQAAWTRLARREDTFRIVQSQDGDHNDERMARARVEVALRKYREADDWPSYYNWFVTSLRGVIAAWGNLRKGG